MMQIPTEDHLSRMYFELAKIGAFCAGSNKPWPYKIICKEDLLAIACDMSRFDPRLFDILVDYFIRCWRDINPAAFRQYYERMQAPQTVAVMMEFFAGVARADDAGYFAEYLCAGLKPVTPQYYFYNLYSPGGKLAQRAVEESVFEFKKWGFFASERPAVNIAEKRLSGSFDAVSRRNILIRILTEKGEISLKDYLDALKYSISRQQALLDIKSSGLVKGVGAGRGAKWKSAA